MGWRTSDYVSNIEKYIGKPSAFNLINNETPTLEQIELYKAEERGDALIEDNLEDSRAVRAPLLSHTIFTNAKADAMKRSFIRHDSEKLTKVIEKTINKTG